LSATEANRATASQPSAFAARTGLDEAVLAAEAVVDPAATIRADVERLWCPVAGRSTRLPLGIQRFQYRRAIAMP
jgi:hypothetical protein